MIVRSKRILEKLIAKNLGNKRLAQAVDQLIADLESDSENAIEELLKVRKDADRVLLLQPAYTQNIGIHSASQKSGDDNMGRNA
jgi:predicted Zn-ribbon and HTH transcriptional regulator